MADVPMFIFDKKRKGGANQKAFIKDTKADIQAVMDLLFKRQMWSGYHYNKWSNELKSIQDEEMLHLWWDAIVSGAMNEVESPKEESLEMYTEMKAEKMMKKDCKK